MLTPKVRDNFSRVRPIKIIVMRINIQSVHFDADQKLLDFIKSKAEKLNRLNNQIIGIDVTLKLENSGQVKDKICEMIVGIPGNNLMSKSVSKSFEQSTDEAVNQLERQLKKIKGKQMDKQRSMKDSNGVH